MRRDPPRVRSAVVRVAVDPAGPAAGDQIARGVAEVAGAKLREAQSRGFARPIVLAASLNPADLRLLAIDAGRPPEAGGDGRVPVAVMVLEREEAEADLQLDEAAASALAGTLNALDPGHVPLIVESAGRTLITALKAPAPEAA